MPKQTFEEIAADIGKLVQQKNDAYGNSFEESGKIMQILYPKGISKDQMVDALLIVRVIDKLARIAHRKDAFNESPWKDIAGYSICGLSLQNEQNRSD